jgi:predicted esterase
VLVLPEGYKKGTPIGVLVGLHGLGHRPDGFVDEDTYQSFADELNMAIVGVSGTVPTGRRSFVWSEDPPTDARQIRRALDDVSDRLTIKPGHLIAFGFSQGAQMGFEIAFQNPDEYLGAIVMSPGTTKRFFRLNKLTPSPRNRRQAFVCLCGAEEAPGNVAFTREDAEFARKAGSRVELKLYEGMDRHAFPPDFAESLVRWARFIEGTGSKPE